MTNRLSKKNATSGKQKRPTFKNQLIVLPSVKQIVDVVGESGARSDINIWRERQKELSDAQLFL